MYLIDYPFVSDFLVNTIKEHNYKIVATKAAQELIADDTLNWISEEEAIQIINNDPHISLYSNSENALAWLGQHLDEHAILRPINVFKDKFKFRMLIKHLFPNFYFEKVRLEDIQELSVDQLPFPFVIKPSIGFFSIGVHIIENEADWEKAKEELKKEKLESIFPENVLNTAHFIIEEFIEGEEYAIDYYHNEKGEVVLLNVMYHLFSSGKDTSDRVYFTSKEIIQKHKTAIESFLSAIGNELALKNFPAHAEIRIDKDGKIAPIEINPLRFGGWCTTGDLFGVTLGFNSSQCYFEKRKPDWDALFEGKEDKLFSLVVLDNNSGIPSSEIKAFDYSSLANDFEHPSLIRKLDIQKYPVFGFVFAETQKQNKKELNDILESNLRKYIN
jgi:hypothetical protein